MSDAVIITGIILVAASGLFHLFAAERVAAFRKSTWQFIGIDREINHTNFSLILAICTVGAAQCVIAAILIHSLLTE